jgi:glutamine amidotransferase
MTRVVVVDYGLGNLHSVEKALRHAGGDVLVTSDPDEVRRAGHLVLPGVGAFPDGMRELRKRGLDKPVIAHAATGKPLLGICLGMQLLLSQSEEFELTEGLGIVPGRVVQIPRAPGIKVPHVGWNRLAPATKGWDGTILAGTPPESSFYFVHSFAALPDDWADTLAETAHGDFVFASVVARGSVVGMQFHPEKSGEHGLDLLRHFVALEAVPPNGA